MARCLWCCLLVGAAACAGCEEDGDIVTLLAMPSRPQPRKVPRTVEAVPSLFQVDEISTVEVKQDGHQMTFKSLALALLLILLLGAWLLSRKEDGLVNLVGRLPVKSAAEILSHFDSPDSQNLGMTRIQGRVVAKNAQMLATPFSDQPCVMYSASASQKRQDGVHQPPLAYHAACSDFAIELETTGPPTQVSVHGHDVSLFEMQKGRFSKEASFSEVPDPWRGFALAHLIHGADASSNAMSRVDLGAQGILQFCESALLHGSYVTCVGEVVRDRNGELSLCPWRPRVEGVEEPIQKQSGLGGLGGLGRLRLWRSEESLGHGQVLISDDPQLQSGFWNWRQLKFLAV